MKNPDAAALTKLLTDAKTVAIVGASSDENRASNQIMRRLLAHGYRVIPVNPNEREVLGQPAVATLASIKVPVDIVDVFRRAESTPEIAREAVAIGAKTLWLQVGIRNDEAAMIASSAGLVVVMDLCIKIELAQLGIAAK